MAQVDFDNAVLDVNPNSSNNPMNINKYMGIGAGYSLRNSSNSEIVSNYSSSVISNTPTKASILFTGTFTASGTQFFITSGWGSQIDWKVSNISFSSGDTYAFVIDIEVSGNT